MGQSPAVLPIAWNGRAQATAVLARAFLPYPLYLHFFPDPAERQKRTAPALGLLIRYCLRYGEVYSTSDSLGAACWLPPGAEYLTMWRMLRVGLIMFPFQIGLTAAKRLERVGAHFEAIRRRAMPQPHWYLMLLGVDPAHQGQGVGRALVQPVFERADTAGLPCYLETQVETNVAIYRRLGFEVVDEGEVPEADCRSWAMKRLPRPTRNR